MPRSVPSNSNLRSSHSSSLSEDEDDDEVRNREAEAIRNAYRNTFPASHSSEFASNLHSASSRTSDADLRSRLPSRLHLDETAGLLLHADGSPHDYRTMPTSAPGTPRFTRQPSYALSTRSRNHSRRNSFSHRFVRAFGAHGDDTTAGEQDEPLSQSAHRNDRVWYDQFTSTDWIRDAIYDAVRVKELRARRDWRGRLQAFFDGAQGWILVAIIGCVTAGLAYFIDVTESTIFDLKTGYCSKGWYYSKRRCCSGVNICDDWSRWSSLMDVPDSSTLWVDYVASNLWTIILALLACLLTLQTKTTISSAISLSTLDENLGADSLGPSDRKSEEQQRERQSPTRRFQEAAKRPPMVYYPAAGSGVAEVKVILSGFVLHGYLGLRTLVFKTFGLILSVASGLSLGKEGPYVHIAVCVGNIVSRIFSKYRHNDAKRREVLSASAAAGVAVAFGAPIGGVLFSLEEVSYYFPPKTLFRTFFCSIVAALSLRFLDPYGTSKIVLFEVRYLIDWHFFELIAFILLGVLGGALGAGFIKASRFWATTFRRIPIVKKYPTFEVLLVALLTGVVSFWNRYTRLPVAELLFELAAPCNAFTDSGSGLCPTRERIPDIIWYLTCAFVVKAVLTTVTFGIKVPAGIYVPSMVVGGLLGRIVGHMVQYLTLTYPHFFLFASCQNSGNPESCVVPGVYALVAAGATMCGVTRLSVTLAVILFELTGSLEHVLPFSLGVLIAKWTADALEPLSIYDLLTDMNAYPFLDTKVRPVFTTELGDITPKPHPNHYIDISLSPLVPAKELRVKLDYLHMAGEIDGGLPILRDRILVGLIPGPDLEFALDRLEGEESALCVMSPQGRWQGLGRRPTAVLSPEEVDDGDVALEHEPDMDDEVQPLYGGGRDAAASDPTDFTPYIDPSPVSLDVCSPMDLVFECFAKLGLRFICVLREGRFVGLVHKKAFVKYVKEVHDQEGTRS